MKLLINKNTKNGKWELINYKTGEIIKEFDNGEQAAEREKEIKELEESIDIVCPFCAEKDFDLVGLKFHFHHCEIYCNVYCDIGR